jgi:hypothetical protein
MQFGRHATTDSKEAKGNSTLKNRLKVRLDNGNFTLVVRPMLLLRAWITSGDGRRKSSWYSRSGNYLYNCTNMRPFE